MPQLDNKSPLALTGPGEIITLTQPGQGSSPGATEPAWALLQNDSGLVLYWTTGQDSDSVQAWTKAIVLVGSAAGSGYGVAKITIKTMGGATASGTLTTTWSNDGDPVPIGYPATTGPNPQAANQVLVITTTSPLPAATENESYAATFAATGGTPPYSWTVSSGSLPSGLSLATNGALTGTPTVSGAFTFTIEVTDSVGGTATQPFALNIGAAPSILAVDAGTQTAVPTEGYIGEPSIALTTAGVCYNLNSITLTAGTYTVIGLSGAAGTALTSYLSATSAAATNIAPTITVGTGAQNTAAQLIGALVTLMATTTIYLNVVCAGSSAVGNASGGIFALQIG
jgi:hypothetical protein